MKGNDMSKINMLVDADSIFFKVAYGASDNKDLRVGYDTFCRKMELEVTNKLINPFKDEEVLAPLYAVKGKNNYRKELSSDYKATRPDLDQDIKDKLNFLHTYALSKGAVASDGMEADDLVSIWGYEARGKDEQYVICGIDKDLLQIPGNHYNYGKNTWTFIDDDTGNYNLMIQCLTGDNADNITGLKGIGPKKAAKILEGVIGAADRWERVIKEWEDKDMPRYELEKSYKLLTMLTSWEDYERIKAYIHGKATVRKPNDVQKQDDKTESISGISK
jgi:DNA polymerase-1